MKTIGLLGGMSWESSLEYYRIINQEVRKKLGGHHSAKCIMYSFNFKEIKELQDRGAWDLLRDKILFAANILKNAGAELIVICTNTIHLMAGDIEKETGLKVLHIVDVSGKEIYGQGIREVGLLGTKFTMEGPFYKEILKKRYGIDVIVPEAQDREDINNIIFHELVLGVSKRASKEQVIRIINQLSKQGAEGVILGCTEIPLLINQEDTSLPIFNTTELHARAAARYALGKGED